MYSCYVHKLEFILVTLVIEMPGEVIFLTVSVILQLIFLKVNK